VCVGVCVYVCK